MFDIDKSGRLELYKGDSPYVIIPDDVRIITTYAFSGRNDIKEVMIPDKVKIIQNRAFKDCSFLEQVRLPASANIGEKSFSNSGLKELMIPGGTQYIGYGAFSGCPELEVVYIEEGVQRLTDTCLEFCPKLHKVTIPASVINIGDNTFCADKDIVIIAPKGSYAEKYAALHSIAYQILNNKQILYYQSK